MRVLPIVAGLTGALLLVAGCSHSSGTSTNTASGPTLHAVGSTGTGGFVPTEKNNIAYLFEMRPLCSQGGRVKISSVTAADATGGMKVVAWGVRRRVGGGTADDNAASLPALPSDYPGFGHQPVNVSCTSKTATEDFDVSVTFTDTRATMKGVIVHYSGGRTTPAQFGLALCTTKKCAPPT